MCFNCGDFIDQCGAEGCYNPDGGPYGMTRKFYVGTVYCKHMREKYGHDTAEWQDRYEEDPHDS